MAGESIFKYVKLISGFWRVNNTPNKLLSINEDGEVEVSDLVSILPDYTSKTISVGTGGTYDTLEGLFSTEPAGNTLINLLDNEYNCVNPQFVIKQGWILQGKGISKTKIYFTFTTALDPDTSGLHIRNTCQLRDLEVTSINDTDSGGYGQYALHSDYPTTGFTAIIRNCSFRATDNIEQVSTNPYKGLTIGLGNWEGQTIEFHNCFVESAGVSYDDKYTINQHNPYVATEHILPSRISYYGCQLSGGFASVILSDVYSSDAFPNEDRMQDLYEFIGCEIKGGLWLRSATTTGAIDKKNGFIFNFSGTTVDEFVNTSEIVDTSLSNYTIKSLPVTRDVEFLRNLGASTINVGDFVCYVYDDRLPEPHLSSGETINTIIGVEKLDDTNVSNFAGISLVTSLSTDYIHLAKGSIAYTSLTSTDLNIGDNVTFDDDGNLIKAWFGGVGTIRKKTFDDRLGIELNPNGEKTNIVGSDSVRGIFEVRSDTPVNGSPNIIITDLSTNYSYRAVVGTNSNAGGNEDGRFAIDDLKLGFERLGISKIGEGVFTLKSLQVVNHPSDSDPLTTFKVGNSTKPGLFKFGNSYNSDNAGEIYQDSSGKMFFRPDPSTDALIIDNDGIVETPYGIFISKDGEAIRLQKATTAGSTFFRAYDETGVAKGYIGVFGATNLMAFDAAGAAMDFAASKAEFNCEVKMSNPTLPDSGATRSYVDVRAILNLTNTPFTLATINALYPNAQNGDRIVCPKIGTGTIYTKGDVDWIITTGTLLT